MLKSTGLILTIIVLLSPCSAFAKDCSTYCQQIRCTPQNAAGVAGSVGACMGRCMSACNAGKATGAKLPH
jgi:hypothetical protein